MANGWQTVASLPPLEAGEVQVWRVDLGEGAELSEKHDLYTRHLLQEEFERSERLRAGQVRLQFIVARAGLRILLGNLIKLPPSLVPITLSAYGKPEMTPLGDRQIFFNVAHSRETILIALCRDGRVGVDLEYIDRETDILEVARGSFTTDEYRLIEGSGDSAQRRRAFFRCWTRKEAVVKADGRGLSLPLNCFEMPVGECAESMPVKVHEPTGTRATGGWKGEQTGGQAATWLVSDLSLGTDIAGAIAVEAGSLRVRTLRLPSGAIHTAESNI